MGEKIPGLTSMGFSWEIVTTPGVSRSIRSTK